jgi:biopolymer transport protein ExbB
MEAGDYKATANYFEGLRTTESAPFVRDLRVLKVTIGTAPLLGLFGTVTGMLATFGALATGSGGDQTMEQIAKGISEALITTETGLIVALPGLFVHYQLARSHERYKAFLARLETACNQAQYKKSTRRKAA